MATSKPSQLKLAELGVRVPSCAFPETHLHVPLLRGDKLARGWLEEAASLGCTQGWAVWAFPAQLPAEVPSGNGWRDDGWCAELGKHAGPNSPSAGLCQHHTAVQGAAALKDILVLVFNRFFFMCLFKLLQAQSSDRSFFNLREKREQCPEINN